MIDRTVIGRRWRAAATGLVVLIAVLSPAVMAAAATPGTPYAWGANPWGQLGDGTNHLASRSSIP